MFGALAPTILGKKITGNLNHSHQSMDKMPRYIGGFVLPIPKDKLSTYQAVAKQAAEIWPTNESPQIPEWLSW